MDILVTKVWPLHWKICPLDLPSMRQFMLVIFPSPHRCVFFCHLSFCSCPLPALRVTSLSSIFPPPLCRSSVFSSFVPKFSFRLLFPYAHFDQPLASSRDFLVAGRPWSCPQSTPFPSCLCGEMNSSGWPCQSNRGEDPHHTILLLVHSSKKHSLNIKGSKSRNSSSSSLLGG